MTFPYHSVRDPCLYGRDDETATGRTGTACAGVQFAVAVSNDETGGVTFAPAQGAIALGPGSATLAVRRCVIDFTFSVRALPSKRSGSGMRGGGPETPPDADDWVMRAAGWAVGLPGDVTTWRVDFAGGLTPWRVE